jgi:hypothetical protein
MARRVRIPAPTEQSLDELIRECEERQAIERAEDSASTHAGQGKFTASLVAIGNGQLRWKNCLMSDNCCGPD